MIDRRLLRIACRAHTAYLSHRPERRYLDLPDWEWNLVRAAHSRWQTARCRGWEAAAERERTRLLAELEGLTNQLRNRSASLTVEQREAASLRDLYADLVVLAADFDDFKLDGPILSVTTEPIALEGIELGTFRIRLDLQHLDADTPYSIEALEPNPAASCDDTPHPHVHGERLCAGEGRAAINASLADGRLLDFFTLVDRVLHTYAVGSDYVELDNWHGTPCHDCDCTVGEDEGASCYGCEERLCGDCYIACGGCSESFCSGCIDRCARCEEYACSGCLVRCRRCRHDVCDACREEELCESCREEIEEEEEYAEEESAASTDAAANRSEPAV
jgi:hypothetical protein